MQFAIIDTIKQKLTANKQPTHYYLDDPKSIQLINSANIHNFSQIMALYANKFNTNNNFEKVLQRQLENDGDLKKYITGDLSYENNDIESINKSLLESAYDYIDRGGKRIRPILCILIAECFQHQFKNQDIFKHGLLEIAELIGAVGEVIHNGSLVIDDIEDLSDMRRGKPCLHLIYGQDIAINVGCYMYFQPLRNLIEFEFKQTSDNRNRIIELQLQLIKQYQEEMINIHIGQGLDIKWHGKSKEQLLLKIPTEDQYLQMTNFKTGVLPRLIAKLISVTLGLDQTTKQKLMKFSEGLGIAFQIQDDLLNIDRDNKVYQQGKGYYGEDIFEGKLTLMVIHCLNTLKSQTEQLDVYKEMVDILKSKTKEKKLIDRAIDIMLMTGSIKYAEELAQKIIQEVLELIDGCLPDNYAKELLKLLAQYTISRNI